MLRPQRPRGSHLLETATQGSAEAPILRPHSELDSKITSGAKDAAEAHSRHVDDCLALLPALNAAAGRAQSASDAEPSALARDEAGDTAAGESSAGNSVAGRRVRLLDIGSGAGLPGLLLAVCRPHWQVSDQERCVK